MTTKVAKDAAEGQAQKEQASRRKKIRLMTLQNIEAALAECREKQGGLSSKFARELLARKKSLTSGGN